MRWCRRRRRCTSKRTTGMCVDCRHDADVLRGQHESGTKKQRKIEKLWKSVQNDEVTTRNAIAYFFGTPCILKTITAFMLVLITCVYGQNRANRFVWKLVVDTRTTISDMDCRMFFALSFLLHCHSVLRARPNCVELWTSTRYMIVTAKCNYYRRW